MNVFLWCHIMLIIYIVNLYFKYFEWVIQNLLLKSENWFDFKNCMWQSLNNWSLESSFTRSTSSLVPWPLLNIFIVSCPENLFHLFCDNFPLAKSVQFWIISRESSLSLSSEVTSRAFGPSGQPKTYGRQSAWSHRHQSGFKLKTGMMRPYNFCVPT